MVSPDDVIDEEAERFGKYFDIEKIEKSKNPNKEFLRQLTKEFDKGSGFNLFKRISNKFKLAAKLYKNLGLGSLERANFNEFFGRYQDKAREKQRDIDESATKRGKGKTRITYELEGQKITYYRARPSKYSKLQEKFIRNNAKLPLFDLVSEFNTLFESRASSIALRDKRLRLLCKK